MGRMVIRPSRCVTVALLALALAAGSMAAQNAVFSGRVTSAGQLLGGANVGIPEIGAGAITSLEGRYSFTVDASKYRGRSLDVLVRYIGYKPRRVSVVITAGAVAEDFDLEKDVLNLEQVVVTGLSDATSQKMTAFAVAVVDASAIREAPGISPLASLAGKVAGASVTMTSGAPGTEPAIRLRSATSLTGRQDPLVIVDGTITRLGLADINSEDIERMEIVKGAAASSLYGSDAANGVIQIFTKRGASLAEGQANFTFRNEYGQSYLPRKVPLNTSTAYELDPTNTCNCLEKGFKVDANGQRIQKADGISDNAYPYVYDNLDAVFKPGATLSNYMSVGQRKGTTNFNASIQNIKETGVLALLQGYSRQNFRINVDQELGENLRLSTGAFYGRSHADQTDEGPLFWAVRFLEPNIDITSPAADSSPFNAVIHHPGTDPDMGNPLYRLNNQKISNDRDRFTGTLRLNYRPLSWLTAEGNFNYDQSSANYKAFVPIGFLNSVGGMGSGSLSQQLRGDRSYNMGATLTVVRRPTRWLDNRTKLAWVYEDQGMNLLTVSSPKLTVPGVTEFGAAAQDPNAPTIPGSISQAIRNQNYFLVTTFDIKDRYVVDALVRQDESSLFGANARKATYHRLSAAWRFTEDFRLKGVDEGKLRVSYGTAGLRPVFDAQYEVLSAVGGQLSKLTLGNPHLTPAYSRETEVGFNLNVFRNYTIEYSYSRKVTSGQIMKVPTSAATGYENTWRNAATLAGSTHELAAAAALISKQDLFWRVNLSADRTRSRITALSVAPYFIGPDTGNSSTRIFHIAAGQALGVIYGSSWIRTPAQLATNIANGNLSGTASGYKLNEEGYYVPLVDWRTSNEKPIKYYDKDGGSVFPIGDVNPDFTLALNSTVQWKRFSLSTLFEMQKGGQIYNYTRHWPFQYNLGTEFDQRGKPQAEKKPQTYYYTFYNNFDPNSRFIEDGSYVRLRELALNYQLPNTLVKSLRLASFTTARLGVVARNLWMSTKYSGYDPDVSGPGGGNPFAYKVDYFTYPAYRTVTVMVELGY